MKSRKPKFLIRTTRGTITKHRPLGPRWATLPDCPAWLRRYEFFTHRSLSNRCQFRLTEASTGFALSGDYPSRQSAIRAGLEEILKRGRKKFQAAVKANQPSQEK